MTYIYLKDLINKWQQKTFFNRAINIFFIIISNLYKFGQGLTDLNKFRQVLTNLTLKKAGGGVSYVPAAQKIACHSSQDRARVVVVDPFIFAFVIHYTIVTRPPGSVIVNSE